MQGENGSTAAPQAPKACPQFGALKKVEKNKVQIFHTLYIRVRTSKEEEGATEHPQEESMTPQPPQGKVLELDLDLDEKEMSLPPK